MNQISLSDLSLVHTRVSHPLSPRHPVYPSSVAQSLQGNWWEVENWSKMPLLNKWPSKRRRHHASLRGQRSGRAARAVMSRHHPWHSTLTRRFCSFTHGFFSWAAGENEIMKNSRYVKLFHLNMPNERESDENATALSLSLKNPT